MLDTIEFVLSHTTHPGNIGAAARAMKTMGLDKLRLVNPKHFPSAEATQRASRADDILAKAEVFSSLQDAIADRTLIVGTGMSNRGLKWPELTPRELAQMVYREKSYRNIAIVFGTESSGLSNEELQLCNYLVSIPANPDYSSLNLASAIQLIAYEFRMAAIEHEYESIYRKQYDEPGEALATAQQTQQLFEHFMQVADETGFFNPKNPKLLPMRIHRIFNKAQLTDSEVRLIRGFLASVKKYDR
ncbi:MAG: RNA methyltransferase [Kangiellaceae bacterium]|jgi:TrmH family RNA methyltransferase|nr:RNA methyltransferase [Kangiellaceae bacterium]